MNKRNTCDKCQHYTLDDLYKNLGDCALMGDINETSKHSTAPDRAYGWDYEGYRAGVYVAPKFGCIHWTKKNKGEQS